MRAVFVGVNFGDWRRRAASRVDLPQRITIIRGVQDDIVLAPCAAARIGSLRQIGDRTSARRNLLELSVGKEAEEPSIGGPEKRVGTVGSSQFVGVGTIEPAHPD